MKIDYFAKHVRARKNFPATPIRREIKKGEIFQEAMAEDGPVLIPRDGGQALPASPEEIMEYFELYEF